MGELWRKRRQGYPSLSEPTKKLLESVSRGTFHHGGHPVLRWNTSCVATVTDGRDNKMFAKPDREKTTARIDGLSAAVNALARVIIGGESSQGYVYTGVNHV